MPFIWGLYGGPGGEHYYTFRTVPELIDFIDNQCQGHLIYAHNGGKFDYHFLREYINTDEPISIIAGRLAKFRIGECEFRDSLNILPVALATFKKDEIDYAILESEVRHEPNNWAKILKYLRGDCQYLYELITEHRKENGVALTQAGASMRSWSKLTGIQPPKQTQGVFRQLKPFYYGGRVQCFESGVKHQTGKILDINSAYPFAMLSKHPFSTKPILQTHLPPDVDLHKCFIELDCTARGCFPLRSEDGSLYFPEDERVVRRYHVTGYEFITALKCNAIRNVSIRYVHYFAESIDFQEFILQNWDRRAAAKRSGNKALDIIVKLLMNSLYGKFASDYEKYRDYILGRQEDFGRLDLKGFRNPSRWTADKWLFAKKIDEEKHRYYNLATAASITGYVRAMLFEAISQTSGAIYCDTDSIACAGIGSLSLGDGLGQWKDEGDFDHYAVAGKKMYAFHKAGAPWTIYHEDGEHKGKPVLDDKGNWQHFKVACKGVDLDPAQIEQAARGQSVTYNPMAPTFSVKRDAPSLDIDPKRFFIDRKITLTAKDIRKMADMVEH